jgi:hypothetical protein
MTENPPSKPPPDDFIIAGKEDQPLACLHVNLAVGSDAGPWEKAYTEYFHAQLWHRYLKAIKTPQSSSSMAGEGFSIGAIQCSLIECVEFRIQGTSYVYSRNGKPPVGPHEYSIAVRYSSLSWPPGRLSIMSSAHGKHLTFM